MNFITGLFSGVSLYAVMFGLGGAVGIAATHFTDEAHYNSVIETNAATYANNMKAVSDKAEEAAAANLKTLQDQLAQTAADSAAAHKELEDAKVSNVSLAASIADGTRRLSVAAVCPGGRGGVPQTSATGPGVHAAPRVQLDPTAAQRIVAIANDADDTAILLKQCQAYVAAIQK